MEWTGLEQNKGIRIEYSRIGMGDLDSLVEWGEIRIESSRS